MSMIQKQIEDLEMLKKCIEWDNPLDYQIILDDAIDTIKTLSEKLADQNLVRGNQYYNGGWIPCDERLPEENKEVIVCSVGMSTIKEDDDEYNYIDIGWYSDGWKTECDGVNMNIEVIAWQPLPERYKV